MFYKKNNNCLKNNNNELNYVLKGKCILFIFHLFNVYMHTLYEKEPPVLYSVHYLWYMCNLSHWLQSINLGRWNNMMLNFCILQLLLCSNLLCMPRRGRWQKRGREGGRGILSCVYEREGERRKKFRKT